MFSIKHPNEVDVLINHVKQMSLTLTLDQFSPFEAISLPLKAGENLIEFVSPNSAITIPAATRLLAVALKNSFFNDERWRHSMRVAALVQI